MSKRVLLALILIQLTLALMVELRPFALAPPGHTYNILTTNFFYPALIRIAKDGSWCTFDMHTTRPVPCINANYFFIFWGKIAGLLSLHPVTMYQIARLTGGIAVFVLSYLFIKRNVPTRWQPWAVLFVLGAEVGLGATESQVTYLRHFGLPHHTWAEAIGIAFLIALLTALQTKRLTYLLLACILGFIVTSILPSYPFTLIVSVFVPLGVWAVISPKRRFMIARIAAVVVAIAVAALLMKSEFSRGQPWNTFDVEKTWWKNREIIVQYSSSLILYTPFILLFLVLTPVRWKHWETNQKMLAIMASGWVFLPFIYIPLSSFSWFPIANGRLVDGYQFLPAGIMAVLGLRALSESLPRLFFWIRILIGGTIAVSALFSLIFLTRIFAKQNIPWRNIYPTTGAWQSIQFTQTLPKNSGLMVHTYMGEIIPAFASVRVFLGGPHGFSDWQERRTLTEEFYSGQMKQPKEFLIKNDVSFVYYGVDERELNKTGSLYPELLDAIFENPDVTIYRRR